ncbi:tetratricopeptide repeat protein [Streptomyces adustus]|uniref:Tetratricopeptide repeat protein n=2 Tax=Streptomyces adustus TaxID=1609272 RepID=A0A5N8VU46_9ACTN|nr:tetratricopeptide repeat protein [Streptomyces adustus]MPY37614.1 tetratricopeptide repeat protein [Streptomyces adustus]
MSPRTNDNAPQRESVSPSAAPEPDHSGTTAPGTEPGGDRSGATPDPAGTATAPDADGTGTAATAPTAPTAPTAAHDVSPADVSSTDAFSTDASSTDASPMETSPPGAPPAGVRVAALRRVADAGRRWRVGQLACCAALLAVALTAGSIAVGAVRDSRPVAAAAPAAVSPALLGSGDLNAGIAALQTHLRAQPRDFGSWATLGLAYVEQARTQGDPSRYPQAEQAFSRSLALAPDNDPALAGRAALAAARHDFKNALIYADRALKQNPYSERALCSRIDALVELGRYDDAQKAADLADARHPGVPVFTRYAYVHELRGDVATARRVLRQALDTATSPGDVAYVSTQLGQLAWNQGDDRSALDYYARALGADENYLPALEGRARAQAASGDRADAITGMENVVSRYPLPGPLVELGELYEARGADGDRAKAGDQYALVDAWIALARANGVDADLDTALAAAEHGDAKAALRAARAEWARRHTVHTADALAWALHVNGRDAEALTYAREATATGYRNASFLYHRGMIELATGHPADARTHLTAALKLNPGFSPLGARAARDALKSLEAAR